VKCGDWIPSERGADLRHLFCSYFPLHIIKSLSLSGNSFHLQKRKTLGLLLLILRAFSVLPYPFLSACLVSQPEEPHAFFRAAARKVGASYEIPVPRLVAPSDTGLRWLWLFHGLFSAAG